MHKRPVCGSTTEVSAAVASALDLCAEMGGMAVPEEGLKPQRLKQQEEAAEPRQLLASLPPRKGRVAGVIPDSSQAAVIHF